MNTAVVVDFIILMDVIVLIKMIFGDDKIDWLDGLEMLWSVYFVWFCVYI